MQLTTKGIEVEQFVGSKKTGEILALSPAIKKTLTKFMTEPDARNIEYATEPSVCYKGLLYELLYNRTLLRDCLHQLAKEPLINQKDLLVSNQNYANVQPDNDDYSILPGSCISHEFDQDFKFSDPNNPYYKIIRDRYQTSIVTTSLHINLGAPDSETAIWLTNSMRLIASQVLALSASSPFHNGKVTGYSSYRWHSFPKTPEHVPIFKDLEHFINWNEEKIKAGEMFNVRHLWASVRPNGPTRPQVLNRVELRIPEFIFDCCQIIGLTSYLEMYFLHFLENGAPKILSTKDFDLVSMLEANEAKVAKDGYDAKIFDYLTESEMTVKEQITRDYARFRDQAKSLDIAMPYSKLECVINEGNFASHLLNEYDRLSVNDLSPDQIIRKILVDETLKQEEVDKRLFHNNELTSLCTGE